MSQNRNVTTTKTSKVKVGVHGYSAMGRLYSPKTCNPSQVQRMRSDDAFKCPSVINGQSVPYWANKV